VKFADGLLKALDASQRVSSGSNYKEHKRKKEEIMSSVESRAQLGRTKQRMKQR